MLALTGGTGHLGQAILRELKRRDIPIGAIVRPASNKALLEDICSWIKTAELFDVDALTNVLNGVSTLIHSAALIDIRRGHIREMRRINVEGTKNVIEACRRAGVERLVYVGSIEAFNIESIQRPVRESFGFADGNAVMEYGETKAEASRAVAAAGMKGDLETLLICPTGIVGPWDFRGGLFTTMIQSFLAGDLRLYVPGGFDFVDVRDVAGAAIAATAKGRSGESYLISGTYAEMGGIFEDLDEITGQLHSRRSLSMPVARFTAGIMEAWGNLFNRTVPLTRGSLAMISKNVRVDSAKAAEELGYASRPLRETLVDLVEWFSNPHSTAISSEPCGGGE